MTEKRLTGARWIAFGVVGLFGVTALIGCGSSYAKVTGKISYKGTPLPSGTITFTKEGMDPGSGEIKNGSYTVLNAPIGECTVTVITAGDTQGGKKSGALDMDDPGGSIMMKKGGGGGQKTKATEADESSKSEKAAKMENLKKMSGGQTPFDTKEASIAIPFKYANPQSSGLKYTVKKGSQIDIDLTD